MADPRRLSLIARTAQIKASTVRILVGGVPVGSGFVLRSDGLIATCFHVVQQITPLPNNQFQASFASPIAVEVPGHGTFPATPHPCCLGPGLSDAIGKDYAVLQIQAQGLSAVTLGNYSAASEGSDVYVCGHPLAIAQPIVARGFLSTKYQTLPHLGIGSLRNAGWMDLTLNRGNSGGPVVVVGASPQHDTVIGLATYILNPYAAPAEEVAAAAASFPGGAVLMGINFGHFAQLVGSALSNNSIGVSGLISIEYLHAAVA